ncbi:MAG: acetyltransferase [Brachybacterium sp.]|nr:acetyltransferase [Brachybacterium sp.]
MAGPTPPPPDPTAPRPGWAPFLTPGTRVVLRYAIDREHSPGGVGRTDALGTIESADEHTVTVMTKRGPDRVIRALVTAAKQVPDPPVRHRSGQRRSPGGA